MKKIILLMLSVILVMSALTACGKSEGAKTGMAIVTSRSKSSDAGEKEGLAQTDSTAVAVLVDEKGVIRNCVIDVVQTKIYFSATGEITINLTDTFPSKNELKEGYNMKDSSPIGKEWYEQAAALAEYVTGKTVAEVKGIAIEEGRLTNEDITGSVTILVADIMDAIVKAVDNAQDLGASVNDKLGLGIVGTISGKHCKNATDEADGNSQAYTHYAAVTLDKNGKITSSIIDASQSNIAFNKEGKITTDLTEVVETKLELGLGYNMKAASPIGKEWFEQSKAFSDYIKGKTVNDVTGIALSEGVATDEDLKSSVTITIGDFIEAVKKAGATAK